MEFLEIADVRRDEGALQRITVHDLSLFCSDINQVLQAESDNRGTVYCVWGENHDPDFIESIEEFLAAWKMGLETHLRESHS